MLRKGAIQATTTLRKSSAALAEIPMRESAPAFWMPFTNNRAFQRQPKLLNKAAGMYYADTSGRTILDASAGLWCSNAGHGHPYITEAVVDAAKRLDYVPSFNYSHPTAFEFADKLVEEVSPPGSDLDHVFFTLCGSTAVDSSLKIALAYWRAKGMPSKTRFVGREGGFHGVGFGGMSVGGMPNNRRAFSAALLPGTDHLPVTHDLEHQAFSKGQPKWGAHLADELENIVALHDASNIAAVIVEPVAGSIGVYVPPAGYLERLREICTKHDILLIFDEVITAFGRVGTPTAAEYFGVAPDMITMAKGLTNAAVPAGAVMAHKDIYQTIMDSANPSSIEFFHGYTYSAHPLACAAGIATLEVYRELGLYDRYKELGQYFQEAAHSLSDHPHVVDVRNLGFMASIDLAPKEGAPGKRGMAVLEKTFFEKDVFMRVNGDRICVSPPLIMEKGHIDQIFGKLGESLKELA